MGGITQPENTQLPLRSPNAKKEPRSGLGRTKGKNGEERISTEITEWKTLSLISLAHPSLGPTSKLEEGDNSFENYVKSVVDQRKTELQMKEVK